MGPVSEDEFEATDDYRLDRRTLITRAGALGFAATALWPAEALAGLTGESAQNVSTTYRMLNANNEPARIDPLYPTSDGSIRKLIFEGLTGNSLTGGDPVNVLAQTMTLSKDRLSIDFTLKRGIKFHRGFGDVTAEDVKFSLERAAGITESKEPSGVKGFFTALKRVQVLGKYSGRLVLKFPSVTLINAGLNEFPAVILSKKAFTTLGETAHFQNPVGTGPYQMGKWNHGQDLTLNDFPGYSGAVPFIPKVRFKSVVLVFIRDAAAAEAAYDTRQLDFLNVPASAVARFRAKKNTAVHKAIIPSYSWIGMNVLDRALSNRNLRRAIINAVDVPAILQAIGGNPIRARAMVAPGTIGYWKDAPRHERNVARARQLLQGVPDADKKLTFHFVSDVESRIVAQVAEQNLAEVGLEVTLVPQSVGGFFINGSAELRKRQLYYTGYGPVFKEPTSEFTYWTCGSLETWNYNQWCNRKFTTLFNRAQKEFDRKQRTKTYIEMQRLWDKAENTVWVMHGADYVAWRRTVVKPIFGPGGGAFGQAFRPV